MTSYTLTCVNNSQLSGSFAVFQRPPETMGPTDVLSLAWLARPTAPDSRVTFAWSPDYCFIWSETGLLQPGISFSASQVKPADPGGENLIQLTQDAVGATTFSNPGASGTPGSLTIEQLSNVVPNRTSVGIGMAGSGTFVVQGAPNMTAAFTPHPNYWVVFGNYEIGAVLDFEEVTGAVEVVYGGSLTSRTATLGLDNLITVE
ncbi:protein rhiA [Ensifer sp. 2YAB10]|uniref:protein rhiA n=1 Tax=unclassified Ensifer TaxID=2633371 RepID=UPI003F90A962